METGSAHSWNNDRPPVAIGKVARLTRGRLLDRQRFGPFAVIGPLHPAPELSSLGKHSVHAGGPCRDGGGLGVASSVFTLVGIGHLFVFVAMQGTDDLGATRQFPFDAPDFSDTCKWKDNVSQKENPRKRHKHPR